MERALTYLRNVFLLCLLFIGGCVAVEPPPPLTFSYEHGNTEVKTAIVETFIQRGYTINRDTQFLLVMDRAARGNVSASLVYGSDWNSVPNARVSFAITGDNPTTATASMSVVTNPGTGFERPIDLTANEDARTQIRDAMVGVRLRLTNAR